MRRFISVFLVLFGLLGFTSCDTEVDKVGAFLIDETNLEELPKGELRFSWRSHGNAERKIIMWLDTLEYNTPDLEAPELFQLGVSSQIKPVIDDVYTISIGVWEPLKEEKYKWIVLSYFDDGTIIESDVRQFVPNP